LVNIKIKKDFVVLNLVALTLRHKF